jgi:hypothetical protein
VTQKTTKTTRTQEHKNTKTQKHKNTKNNKAQKKAKEKGSAEVATKKKKKESRCSLWVSRAYRALGNRR